MRQQNYQSNITNISQFYSSKDYADEGVEIFNLNPFSQNAQQNHQSQFLHQMYPQQFEVSNMRASSEMRYLPSQNNPLSPNIQLIPPARVSTERGLTQKMGHP